MSDLQTFEGLCCEVCGAQACSSMQDVEEIALGRFAPIGNEHRYCNKHDRPHRTKFLDGVVKEVRFIRPEQGEK